MWAGPRGNATPLKALPAHKVVLILAAEISQQICELYSHMYV